MIVIDGLTKKYGPVTAVDWLDLTIRENEIFGLLGPNGAGKTTTIRIMTTLTRPTSGSVTVNGHDVVRDALAVKNTIGVVQQAISLDQDLTVRENLEVHGRLHHLGRTERRQRIAEMLEYVEMTGEAERQAATLSGGMKRRLMIARALLHRPEILILDEPTAGLDAPSRRRLWDLIRRMNRAGATVILTTHYIEEAEALCGHVGIIDHGKLIALGTPLELRQRTGLATVETTNTGQTTGYRHFPDADAARTYVQSLPPDTGTIILRKSNLEDVFIELTGRKVGDER